MFKLFLLLILSLTLCFSNYIDSIVISGNKKTKEYVIEREILQNRGSYLDSLKLIEDKNRLYNLGIFSTVDINYDKGIYKVNVIESFSILPDLIIDYSEIKRKWSYGIALVNINFLGLNQKLYCGGAFIGEKWFAIGIENPWVFGDHISLGSTFYNRFTDNPFYDFTYYETLLLLNTGFYKGLKNRFSFDISFYKNKKDKINSYQSFPENEKNLYKYINLGFNYIFDSRDIYNDPLKGSLFDFNFNFSKSIIDNNSDISELGLSFQQFFLIDSKILHEPVISYKMQSLFKFPIFKNLPIHEYEYIGGEDFVKGYSSFKDDYPDNFNKNIEVSNILYASLELQSTLLKKKDYGKIEFGMDGLIFANYGIGSYSINSFSIDNLLFGYGFGLKFFVTGPPPISIMFGFNPYGQKFTHFSD